MMETLREIAVPARPGDATARIQAALDAGGPVRVVLGAGRHESGGLRLGADTALHLDPGAELAFRPDYDAYRATQVGIEAEGSDRAMIVAEGARNVALTGAGRITCDGAARFSRGDDGAMGTRLPAALRPRVLVFDGCRDVEISGIAIEDSPMWTLHLVDCDRVRVSGVRIDNDRRMPNTDGIVIDGCRDVAVTGCEIRTADDGIVLKTSARIGGGVAGICADIRVSGCLVESRSCALKIGTESHAGFRRILFEDCRVEASNRGLGIFSRDGGAVEEVRFARIELDCRETPDGFWGSGEALTINTLDRRAGRPAGPVRGVRVEGVTGRMEGAITLVAERPGAIDGVVLDGIRLAQAPGALGTARRYDLRPTRADLAVAPGAAGRANAWALGPDGVVAGLVAYPGGMPALFAEGVTGLELGDFEVTRPDPLPEGWSAEPVVTGKPQPQ